MSKVNTSRRKLTPYLVGTVFTASFGGATSGHAEVQALEEVIVTAQKREESVQSVPIAITALTQEALATNRVANVTDLSGLAPNLAARPAPGGSAIASFSMRGITSYGIVPGSDKEISIYLDGVYIGSPRGSIFNLPDIAQLEVLRGPQGTLFGRNATAGAINITTRDPAGELGLRQELSVGNHNYKRSRTSVDSPTWGPFSFAATYAKEERDGDIKNSAANGQVWDRTAFGEGTAKVAKRFGDKDADSYFLAAKFQPTDTFTMTYKFDRNTDTGTPSANVATAIVPGLASLLYSPNILYPGAPAAGGTNPPKFLGHNARRPNSAADSYVIPSDITVNGHSLTTVADVSDNISIKNITAYRKSQITSAGDLSGLGGLVDTTGFLPSALNATPTPGTAGAPFCFVCSQQAGDADQWSTEFQVNYESELLTLTVGALYFESSERGGFQNGANTVSNVDYPNYVIPAGNVSTSYNDAQSLAAYSQAEFHVSDEVDLLLGVRETRDRKSGDFQTSVGSGPIDHREFKYEKSKPSFMLGVNYKPSYDTLVYGKYSSAFVSGGSTAGLAYEPETAKAWEAGLKSDFLDSQLRSNLSVFYVTYQHVQSAQGSQNVPGYQAYGTVIVDQGSDTKASGFEWEGLASVGYGVTLNASVGYTHVTIDSNGLNPLLQESVQFSSYPGSKYVTGLIPEWTGNLGAQYESDPLFGQSFVALTLGGNWHSKVRLEQNPARAEANPDFVEFSPASWVVNARAALKKIDLGFAGAEGEIGIWGRNLTDNDTPNFALSLGGAAQSASFLEARSYGVDLIAKF